MKQSLTLDFPHDFLVACTVLGTVPERLLQSFVNDISMPAYLTKDQLESKDLATSYLSNAAAGKAGFDERWWLTYQLYNRLLCVDLPRETAHIKESKSLLPIFSAFFDNWYDTLRGAKINPLMQKSDTDGNKIILPPFLHIEVSGSLRLILQHTDGPEWLCIDQRYNGESTASFKVENNRLTLVCGGIESMETFVIERNGRTIFEGNNLNIIPTTTVYIGYANISSITLRNYARLYSKTSIRADVLTVSAYENSEVSLAMKANYFDCVVKSGSSMLTYGKTVNERVMVNDTGRYLSEMCVENTHIKLTEAAIGSVFATGTLTAYLNDHAKLVYSGRPKIKKISCLGESQAVNEDI